MADSRVGVALVLSAKNQASVVLDEFFSRTEAKMKQFGKGMAKIGEGVAEVMAAKQGIETLKQTTDAYGEMEQAGNYLKATLMGKGGIYDKAEYEKVFQYTKNLSAQYTGSVASYLDMVRVMKQNRLGMNDVMGGIGEGAAKLSIYFDNMLPAATAEFASHMKNDMGVATSQMYEVMDLVARVHDSGVGKTGQEAVDEMNQFFSKVGLGLANLHTQGLEASKQMAALGTIFMAKGISGQSVGTNFRRILDGIASGDKLKKANIVAGDFKKHLDFFDSKGKFLGVENFVNQMGKLQGLNPAAVEAILKPFSGKQGLSTDFLQFLANDGVNTYAEMKRKIEQQASLNDKVGVIMQGQKMQESVMGSNITNTNASFGKAISAPYKELMSVVNRAVVSLGKFFDTHQGFVRVAAGFVAVASAGAGLMGVIKIMQGLRMVMMFLGVSGPIASVVAAFKWLQFAGYALRYNIVTGLIPMLSRAGAAFMSFGASLLANPITLYIAAAVALAAIVYLVIKHWDKIRTFFVNLWNGVTAVFKKAWDWFKNSIFIYFFPALLIFKYWDQVKGFFVKVWEGVKVVFIAVFNFFKWVFLNLTPVGWIVKFWEPLSHLFKGIWDLTVAVFKAAVYGIWLVIKNLTPIGWIYSNWTPITKFFSSIWDGVKKVFSVVWVWVKRLFWDYRPEVLIYRHWGEITKWFGRVWDGVKAAFHVAWEWIKRLVLGYTPVGLIYSHWGGITAWFSETWNKVKGVFGAFWNWITGWVKGFWDAGVKIVENIIGGIKSMITKVGDAMSGVATKIRSYLPFSPAKAGALRDIHKIQLFETIAKGLNGAALINKVREVMAMVRQQFVMPQSMFMPRMGQMQGIGGRNLLSFMTPAMVYAHVPVFNGFNPTPSTGGQGLNSMVTGSKGMAPVNMNVNITLTGGATKQDAKMVAESVYDTFDKNMKKWMQQNDRLKYRS